MKQNVEDLENSEKEGVAENILAQALKKASDKPHEAYEIEMLLVEVLIYKVSNFNFPIIYWMAINLASD